MTEADPGSDSDRIGPEHPEGQKARPPLTVRRKIQQHRVDVLHPVRQGNFVARNDSWHRRLGTGRVGGETEL